MNGSIYSKPLRVYTILGLLTFLGIWSGFNLPVSLFPNSTRPEVKIWAQYGAMSAEEYRDEYGRPMEEQLKAIHSKDVMADRVIANYEKSGLYIKTRFRWGDDPQTALREVQAISNSFIARVPQEPRYSISSWIDNENSGFLAVSYFSDSRSLDEIFDILDPMLKGRLAQVEDAGETVLWNPSRKEVRVEMRPEVMATTGLVPADIQGAITTALESRRGGSLTVGSKTLLVEMPRQIKEVGDLGDIIVSNSRGAQIPLRDIATITYGIESGGSRSFKTSGTPSLILFATPKAGGNIKKMSDDILQMVADIQPSLPPDVHHKIVVDPSQFISSAVENVVHEVVIGALLAVLILFIFIGSFKNVVTAAIEIPISLVLAFIGMRLAGMNINLISLGGLALSAGMNVDASVVVMENIFRHFESVKTKLTSQERLAIVIKAVREVQFPVIASTIASLVVFLPLAFTSHLSYAILGDLAKAVVFSHAFSAVVALVLVPTVRLHIMNRESTMQHPKSPIEGWLRGLENFYGRSLARFMGHPYLKWLSCGGLVLALMGLVWLVMPNLPQEVIGKPDTDWVEIGVSTDGNTLIKQMEYDGEVTEKRLLDKFSQDIAYTFSQINNPNSAWIMARIKDKSQVNRILKALEHEFTNTPKLQYEIQPWNPSELQVPNPPDIRFAVRGGTLQQRADTAKDLSEWLQAKKIVPNVWTEPSSDRSQGVFIAPNKVRWALLRAKGLRFGPNDLTDIISIATESTQIAWMPVNNKLIRLKLAYPRSFIRTVEDIKSLPVMVGDATLPFSALADIRQGLASPPIYRENGEEFFLVLGERRGTEKTGDAGPILHKAQTALAEWNGLRRQQADAATGPTVTTEDARVEINEALHQLAVAVGWSVALIFLTMVVQFGSFIEPLLVLVSVPLGFIGVTLSLSLFHSTLSLNSVLGIILLNGIAVANSIMLVDFIKHLHARGLSPEEAGVEAARKRLRPILITSLTTVLGMLPIALGFGEGGKILQPLGIAVSGGLWISMILTLYVVPALHVAYLKRVASRRTAPIQVFAAPAPGLETGG